MIFFVLMDEKLSFATPFHAVPHALPRRSCVAFFQTQTDDGEPLLYLRLRANEGIWEFVTRFGSFFEPKYRAAACLGCSKYKRQPTNITGSRHPTRARYN